MRIIAKDVASVLVKIETDCKALVVATKETKRLDESFRNASGGALNLGKTMKGLGGGESVDVQQERRGV